MARSLAAIKINRNTRYALLAGSMLTVMAAAPSMAGSPQSGAEGAIILAQAIDQQQPKGKAPPPKGQPPAAIQRAPAPQPPAQPKAVQQPQPPVQPRAVQPAPQPPAQPRAVQPAQPPALPKAVQPAQPPVQPKALQPAQPRAVQPAQPPAQPRAVQPVQPPAQPKAVQPAQPPAQPRAVQPAPGVQPVTPPAVGAKPQVLPGQPAQTQPQPVPGVQPGTPPAFGARPQPQPGVQPVPGGPAVLPGQPGQPAMGRPAPGAVPPPQGAVVTPMRGNVDQLRVGRVERTEPGGRVIIQEPGGRVIIREGGRPFIRHDETERFRMFGGHRFEDRGAERFAYVTRPGGYQIITVTGHDGRVLRRMRRGPDGREVVLFSNAVVGAAVATGFILALAAPQILIPRERYIVNVSAAQPALLYETLDAPPVVPIERAYALDEIRNNVNLRDRVRRIDLDGVTFETGSWEVTPDQFPRIQVIADAIQRVLSNRPDAVFMIEGHTDAVGSDVDNLSLSDRRAESVAVVLTEQFQIPPENLVTQGYGEQFPKVPTDGPSRENRRVSVRNISGLLAGK